ncbi:dephospho-CoA kinase [Bacteroidales bacterium OttesenSCG-928-I14]|nr:dephospho-CoA kinase [Bacteroidales bacterium OttesenSCG-928-I14]
MKKIIGLTGGIGSGKSIVSRLLETMNIPVYNTDIEAKRIMHESPIIKEKLINLFGNTLYSKGVLDRQKLSSLIFSDKENLNYVNGIVHPEVGKDFQEWVDRQENEELVAIESAILFESGFDKMVDVTVSVTASIDIRIERVIKRDGTKKDLVLNRIKNQMSEEERNKKSNYVIINNETEALIPQVEYLVKTFYS